MNRTTSVIFSIINKICILVLIATAVLLIRRIYWDRIQLNTEREMYEIIHSANAEEIIQPNMDAPTASNKAETPISACVEAYAKNPDFVAMLEAGEDIALFVVQGEDNDYYMDHDFSGNYSAAGNAFLDARCSLEPRDTHSIIHGHNMKNGTVFGNLDKFRDLQYLKSHPIVTYTLMYEVEYYVPYAILDISAESSSRYYYKVTEWNFDTEDALNTFTEELKSRSFFTIPIDVEPGDILLTLSTCSYSYENGRLLIACRKLRADETPESMVQLMQEAQ